MPQSSSANSSPKKILNLHVNKPKTSAASAVAVAAVAAVVIKKKVTVVKPRKETKPRELRPDGTYGNGLQKRNHLGELYYRFWTADYHPAEYKMLVHVTVDSAAENMGVEAGTWTYDKIRKHSLERMREIPHYCNFGAQLHFTVPEEQQKLEIKKGIFTARWVDGSDRAGYYSATLPSWKQETCGISSAELYHDMQQAAYLATFE